MTHELNEIQDAALAVNSSLTRQKHGTAGYLSNV